MSAPTTRLLFVYNADTGLFNTMADIGHKIFSPSTYKCDLCMLTHGYFSERDEWRDFVESLQVSAEFIHRDEFRTQYPDMEIDLPAVIIQKADSPPKVCINARSLHDCKDLDGLKNLVKLACENA